MNWAISFFPTFDKRKGDPQSGDKIGQGYLVESQGGCLNDYVVENRVFVPDVGLTSAHWTSFGFCWTNETWALLDFDL